MPPELANYYRRQGAAFTGIVTIAAIAGCVIIGWELTCAAGIILGAFAIGKRCLA